VDPVHRHSSGDGIALSGVGGSKVSVVIDGNEVTEHDGRGIYCHVKDSSKELSGTITNNTVGNIGNYGIYLYTYCSLSPAVDKNGYEHKPGRNPQNHPPADYRFSRPKGHERK